MWKAMNTNTKRESFFYILWNNYVQCSLFLSFGQWSLAWNLFLSTWLRKFRLEFITIYSFIFLFFFSGNVTEQKCNEVLATTTDYDVTDGSLTDLIVNCKINQEIIPRLLGELKTCKEEFPPYGRLVYSCSCQFIQYVLPTITISVAYYQIYGQLKIRLNQKMRQLEIRCLEITGDWNFLGKHKLPTHLLLST